MNNELLNTLKEFDEEHIIKQIIFIGLDGKIKNIEFNMEEEDEKE